MKEKIKKVLQEKHPLILRKRRNMRKRLHNTSPTFLCPNCIGGILFHDLGLRFCSPTVNLMMLQPDFAKFVLNLDYYLQKELLFFNHPEYTCPCAYLGDLVIHFTHYHSEIEAKNKWEERVSRIDKDNLFVFLEERDGLTEDTIRDLGQIHSRGLVVFTASSYPDIPYAVQIPKYARDGEVGNILALSYLTGHREYEKYFDFVEWFNNANGWDYVQKDPGKYPGI